MKSVMALDGKLKLWQNKWEWADTLKFSSIGSPKQIINEMKEGTYKPTVTDGAKRSAVRKMKVNTKHHNYNITELQHDWDVTTSMVKDCKLQKSPLMISLLVMCQ